MAAPYFLKVCNGGVMIAKIKLAIFSLMVGVFCNFASVQAYGTYAAVWHNKQTKSTLRVIGDYHAGDDLKFCQRLHNALKNTQFTPFYIGETSHDMVGILKRHANVNSENFGMLKYLTLGHYWKKDSYKKNISVVKQQPNLFSKKDRVIPRDGNFQALSPLVGDLRIGLQDLDDVIKDSLLEEVSLNGLSKFFPWMSKKQNIRDFNNFCCFNDPYLRQLCSDANMDFKVFRNLFLKTCQTKFKRMNASYSTVTKVFLEDVGNHMLACEEILKKTGNYALLKAFNDLCNVLQENLLIEKDSTMDLFINGTLSADSFSDELAEKVGRFWQAMYLDLTDFGYLAKTIQVMPFVENIVIYAGDAHVWGIEQHLKKAGYVCVWEKCNDTKTPLSQQDLETFFSVKTEPTTIKSKL